MSGVTDVIAILFLIGVFYALGFRIVRRSVSEELAEAPHPDVEPVDELSRLERRHILLKALNEPPYTEILSPRQRDRLRHSLLHPGDTWVDPAPIEDFEQPVSSAPESLPEPVVQPSTAFVLPVQAEAAFEYAVEPALEPTKASTAPAVTVPPEAEEAATSAPPKAPRKPVMETIRASWDPAVMMLYLGALLVVVAGLIFATYNWGNLGGWQKMGLLAAGTAAFLIAGFAILNIERVKPASTTFMVIGGLLVPANFLAGYTVFDDVQPALPLLLGAIATMVIHGLLSYQPGASLFRYSAVGAAIIAIATIPAAFGFPAGWGGVLGLVVIAVLPDSMFGASRFREPWLLMGRTAAGLLFGFAVWQGWGEHGWLVAGALVSVSMVATRFAHRYPAFLIHLISFADLALIAASIQIAHNFDGDHWMIAAGILALTLVLIQESRRFSQNAHWLEFAASFSAAALAGEIVRVLGTDTWAIAAGSGVLAILMLWHGHRHPGLAGRSEPIAAVALPVSFGMAVYAVDPSLWSIVVGLATLTVTMVLLGLRRAYTVNWPGLLATAASFGTVITLAPAIGPDVGWGCVAALFIIAIAPYPFGRLESFRQPWLRFSNVLAAPIGFLALWRGAEVHDWLIPLTLVAISMWLTRMALEEMPEAGALNVGADVFAVFAGISFAWVIDNEQWMLAAGLLGLTLALLKRSYTWPRRQNRLQFVAAFAFAFFVGEVTREYSDIEWGIVATAAALTIAMLIHARLHPHIAWISEGVVAWSLPFAIGTGILTWNESHWFLPIALGVLTLTLIAHRIRHQRPGDIMLAISSFAGILAVMDATRLLDVGDDSRQMAILFSGLGLAVTAIANAVLTRFSSVSGWLKNLLRLEALPLFFFAMVVGDFDYGLVFAAATLAMFWNLWTSRVGIWSLPMVGAIAAGWLGVVMPAGADGAEHLWWMLGLAALLTAVAWQLDRRSQISDEQLHAGVYSWLIVTLITSTFHLAWFYGLLDDEAGIWYGIALLLGAALHLIGFRSTRSRLHILPAALLILAANFVLLLGEVSSVQHGVIAAIALGFAAILYWQGRVSRIWLAFTAAALGVVHAQMATDFDYSRDVLIALVVAWVLVSLAITRWRNSSGIRQSTLIFYQAMLLHGLALILPLMDHAASQITRPDLVLALVSLAGLVATFGSLQRSRELVLLGSAIGMSAFMLQVNIGSPGNLHAYTVPLSIYLLAVGLLLRRDARIANTLLAAGSAILVIPAMLEALTTGEITWLWIALAESLGLFLFGTVLRLRIPTAAAVIAVSVIALRMLVFAVSVLESWVSILAVGLALLLIGTMWLVFRDAIQAKVTLLFGRWQAFE